MIVETELYSVPVLMNYLKNTQQELVTFDNKGQLTDKELKMRLAGQQVVIMYIPHKETENKQYKSIVELMETTSITLDTDNLTKEWIHDNIDNNDMYR